jgi:aryl sulfotransferase
MIASARCVWLASFPKSGNTWFRLLLANLTGKDVTPADINVLAEHGAIASSRQEFEAATLLDSSMLSHDEIDVLRPHVYAKVMSEDDEERWNKVHDAFVRSRDGRPLFGRDVARAAIYLVRDPRDVAVSFAFHSNTTIDDAIDFINSADGALCGGRLGLAVQLRQKLTGWSGHVTSWSDQTELPVHLVHYEKLLESPVEVFSKAMQFAGRSASTEDVDRAVRHADFAELQRQESEKGFAERVSRTTPFFRSGRAGGWRQMLTEAQVAAIERCHGPVMARLGYQTMTC